MTKPANATFDSGNFSRRHIGIAPHDVGAMLETVDAKSLDDLIDQTIPASIRQHTALAIGPGLSELEVLRKLRRTATKNKVAVSLIGQGYYGTILPPVIQRNILENPAWYTAYTPYQPEISQGRLEALLNFQTMVADLTGLPIANASLLDEATAAAEAMAMAHRLGRNGKTTFFIDADCHPQTIAVVRTRAEPLGWQVVVGDPRKELDASTVFGALLQYPGCSGEIHDFRPTISALHAAGALAILAADPLALALLVPPGTLAPTSPSARCSALASPWAMAARTRPISRPRMNSSARFPAVSWVYRSTAAGHRPIVWPCRRASSTSAARRRPPISAPRKCCWRWSPRCTASTTGRMA